MSLTEEDKRWISEKLDELENWIHTRLMSPEERRRWDEDIKTDEDREREKRIDEFIRKNWP